MVTGELSINMKLKIRFWVYPLIRIIAIFESMIPGSMDLDKVTDFIVKHGIKVTFI